ncbi:g8275 [Coccomyxa elongata]
MGKKKIQYDGGHYSRGPYNKDELRPDLAGSGEYGGLERHALYESAVQSPQGDISYLLRFYKQYVGVQVPEHLREDFCGTALISATWCRGDVRRTAIGLDIDREALEWGLDHNGGTLTDEPRPRLCLFQGDVCDPLEAALPVSLPAASADDTVEAMAQMTLRAEAQATGPGKSGNAGETGLSDGNRSGSVAQEKVILTPMMESSSRQHGSNKDEDEDEEADSDGGSCAAKPVDITCALNFSVCLLHLRSDVVRYFRHARQALNTRGGILVMDLLGGHAAESTVSLPRHNEVTGAHFVWEQEGYNPVTRHIRCYIHLRDPATRKVLRRAFRYDWRLWTIPELAEMLEEAGFDCMRAWLRPMKEGLDDESDEGSCSSESSADEEADFVEYNSKAFNSKQMDLLSKGWTAFIVGIVAP